MQEGAIPLATQFVQCMQTMRHLTPDYQVRVREFPTGARGVQRRRKIAIIFLSGREADELRQKRINDAGGYLEIAFARNSRLKKMCKYFSRNRKKF